MARPRGSVGFLPVAFSPQRRLGHGAVHGQKAPVDADQFVVVEQARVEEAQERAVLAPAHDPVVGGGRGADARDAQRVPLAAGAEHKEDARQAAAVVGRGPPAAEAVRVHARGDAALELGPELIRDRETRRGHEERATPERAAAPGRSRSTLRPALSPLSACQVRDCQVRDCQLPKRHRCVRVAGLARHSDPC